MLRGIEILEISCRPLDVALAVNMFHEVGVCEDDDSLEGDEGEGGSAAQEQHRSNLVATFLWKKTVKFSIDKRGPATANKLNDVCVCAWLCVCV